MADEYHPISAEDLAASFETLVRDGAGFKAARALGAALGWGEPPAYIRLNGELFALVTIAGKKLLKGRGKRCQFICGMS
jgi:hypothetical protein